MCTVGQCSVYTLKESLDVRKPQGPDETER